MKHPWLPLVAKGPGRRFTLPTVFSKPNPKAEQFSSMLKSGQYTPWKQRRDNPHFTVCRRQIIAHVLKDIAGSGKASCFRTAVG